MKSKTKSRISRIGIGRLYNLGSYEHVRYDLTVDVPEGGSALKAFKAVLRILRALNPKPPVDSYHLERAKKWVITLDKEGEIAKEHHSTTTKSEINRIMMQRTTDAIRSIKRYDRWIGDKERAEKIFDQLGGVKAHKDSKLDWEPDYNDED